MVLAIVVADRGVHGHFCSSDVLYLQKTDLYLGLRTHVVYMCSFIICVDRSSKDLRDCPTFEFPLSSAASTVKKKPYCSHLEE